MPNFAYILYYLGIGYNNDEQEIKVGAHVGCTTGVSTSLRKLHILAIFCDNQKLRESHYLEIHSFLVEYPPQM